MVERGDEFPIEPLEDIAYLSRSHNRVVILDALTDGPRSRRALAELTGVPRTTLDRIVNELEEKGWAERTADGTYEATTRGTHIMRRFSPFLESVEAIHQLGDAITWLPIDELSIGLEHFNDAFVRQPETADPVETIDFMNDLLANASEFRVLAHLAPPEPLGETMYESVVSGQMSLDGVITDTLYSYLCDNPERAERWRTLVEAGADLRWNEDPIPCNLWIFDETVLIKKSGPEPIDDSYGVPIVSDDSTVLSWAHDLIDEWMAQGTRINGGAFVENSTA